MAATLPITENFDGMSLGELNGNTTGGSTWAGTNGVFAVDGTAPDSGTKDILATNNGAGNRGCFLPTSASSSGTQSFKIRVDSLPVNTDAFYVCFHNQTVNATDPSTGKICFIGVQLSGGNYNAILVAASTATIASAITTSSYHSYDLQWDKTMGTKGQVRARIDSGTWTSWLDPAGTTDFASTGVLSIGLINEGDVGTNTIYFDTFTGPITATAQAVNNFLLMGI